MMPIASVVIPVRNEEADISGCLAAVDAQDLQACSLEVIVADGDSQDRTREIVLGFRARGSIGRLTVVDNPSGGISSGLNAALAVASSDVIVRVDARSRIERHYIRSVVDLLRERADIGVAGGGQVPIDRGVGVLPSAIARALGNRFTTGLSRYRRGRSSGPSDTVWMGAFRADELRAMGGWNEHLAVNEDYELCDRYRKAGMHVWFQASLRSGYLARSDLASLAHQYYRYGVVRGLRWRAGAPFSARHMLLVAAPVVASCLVILGRRRVRPQFMLAGIALGSLAIDHIGSASPAPIRVRVCAVVASVVANSAWWVGVAVGLAGGQPGQRRNDVRSTRHYRLSVDGVDACRGGV